MKNLLATIALCAFTTPAIAAPDANAVCTQIGNLAESIMDARQRGISPSAILNATKDVPVAPYMVTDAFEVSRWYSEALQSREAQDFRAIWEMECYANVEESV